MKLNCDYLLQKAGVEFPVVGFYDTPDPASFHPLVRPAEGKWACLYMFFNSWKEGDSLHLTSDNYGCGGLGTYLFGIQTRNRREYIDFLYGEEGLKASAELMGEWIDHTTPYQPEHDHIVVGPLQDHNYDQLKTVTFFVNPDQLSLFVTGAYYFQGRPYPPRVIAPFASGCGLIAPLFRDLDQPEAIIGSTDIAMRKYLPPDILAFTVTKPMYEQLCTLDEGSFLDKPFWKEVQETRERENLG
jgi:hypothetical protein